VSLAYLSHSQGSPWGRSLSRDGEDPWLQLLHAKELEREKSVCLLSVDRDQEVQV